MNYHAILDATDGKGAAGQEHLIEITPRGGSYRIAIHPGAEESTTPRILDVDAVHLQGHAVSILAGTRSARCDIEPGKEGRLTVLVGDTVHSLELLDERRLRLRRAGGKFTAVGPQRVDAPMPGKVVRVLVKQGDQVTEGQGLVVVEAMKMENELKSPKAGRVVELHAVEGAAVESGAKLVVVS